MTDRREFAGLRNSLRTSNLNPCPMRLDAPSFVSQPRAILKCVRFGEHRIEEGPASEARWKAAEITGANQLRLFKANRTTEVVAASDTD